MAEDVVVVLVTCASMDDATHIARAVVEGRKAACVNILPQVRSIYRWEGAIHDDPELLLVIKTTREMFEALSTTIREAHPYAVPEIIALPVTDGYDGYLRWVVENVGSIQDPT
ncbi:MAG: divalent-cation tolerance protein CutA [Pseudomonadota bacterium]